MGVPQLLRLVVEATVLYAAILALPVLAYVTGREPLTVPATLLVAVTVIWTAVALTLSESDRDEERR